jgi:hypothetical protein
MDCKVFRQEFEALNAGEQPGAKAQAHLDACLACRTFQSERLSLRQLIGSLGPVSAPPDFDFRLRARLAAAKGADNYSFHRKRFAPGLKAISVAASFALLITSVIVFKQFQSAPVGLPATSQPTTAANQTEGLDTRPQPKQNSEQLATAAKGQEAAPVENISHDSNAGEAAPASNKAGKPTRAEVARHSAPSRAAERSPIISNDLALRGNPTVVTPVRQPTASNSTGDDDAATTLLRVSSQPVRILLHDKQGAMRSVSLEPVIFGSQSFLERAVQRRPLASDAEGIW